METFDDERYLTEREVSELLSVSLSKLRQDRMKKVGLPYVKWQGRLIRYPLSKIHREMQSSLIQTEG